MLTYRKFSIGLIEAILGVSLISCGINVPQVPTSNSTIPEIVEPTNTPAIVPSPTEKVRLASPLDQLFDTYAVVRIQNDELQMMATTNNPDGRKIYENYQRLISENSDWSGKKASDFNLMVMAYDTGDGRPESILFGTLGDQTYVISRSKQGGGEMMAINAPLAMEDTEEGVSYFYQDKTGNRVDLLWDGEMNGQNGIEITLLDGAWTKFFPDSQLADGVKATPDAVIAGLTPAKLEEYVHLTYENGTYVKQDDARLIVGKLDSKTGEWTEMPDGMLDTEREEYRNLYPQCTKDGVLVSAECAVVPVADFESGKVLKHIYALMDEMPALPENRVEIVKMRDDSGIFIVPRKIPSKEELPYDIVNAFYLDDPIYRSITTGEHVLCGLVYVRIHNKNGTYSVLPMNGNPGWLKRLVETGGKVNFAPVIENSNLEQDIARIEKAKFELVDMSWSRWRVFKHVEVARWFSQYIQTGNLPRGLADIAVIPHDFSKAKYATPVD